MNRLFFVLVCLVLMSSTKTDSFIDRWDAVAIDMSRRTDIPASVLLACGALESGWGTSRGALKYNAFHGIKGKYQGKHWYQNSDGIARAYPTAWESWKDHAFLIKDRKWYPRYKPGKNGTAKEWAYWISRWHVGLKVSKEKKDAYYRKVMRIINSYNLKRFDNGNEGQEV